MSTVPAAKDATSPRSASVRMDALTPAMRQYVEQKQRVGEAVLLFRMGDFYETFYEDAVLCAKVLGIALTSRSKGKDAVPLAGIPYHALDGYLQKLVTAGYKVAISEQLEDPKQAKGVVRRDVVRIVTAGTLTEESLLADKDDNILASICQRGQDVGLALVELAGGRFEVVEVTNSTVLDELVRNRPAELLIDDQRDGSAEAWAEQLHDLCQTAVSRRPAHEFSRYQAKKSLLEHLGVTTLAGFGFETMSASLCAAGCILQYLAETQKTALTHITSIGRRATEDGLQIDHSSWRALEIERTLRSGSREGTLLHAIDRTVHAIGGRKLRRWLRTPLTDPRRISLRQDAVAYLVENDPLRKRLRGGLKEMSDVERIAGRVALGRATPRDLAALARTLVAVSTLTTALTDCRVDLLEDIATDLDGLDDLAEHLRQAIREDPPGSVREGGFIADGFNDELDRLRTINRDGQTWLSDFQRRESERIRVSTLKVGFHRVFGYYIEIPNASRDRVPPDYLRKQTVKHAERYITEELKTHETEVLTAADRATQLEMRLFEQVRAGVAQRMESLMRFADAIGRLDGLAGLAELAVERRFVRPQLVEGIELDIRDGRHVVLDQTLGDRFVPNDTQMVGSDARVFVITGPNMAGKSTYIRQVALMTLIAQIGSFVPAQRMHFSIADRIFARVGAADEIMRGQSTFLVEMIEAANILHHATERSLVVLDELGRGTSTFDGLSLAWAITEHLANEIRCRSLVATHYHELTELAELLRGVRNYNVAVRENPSADSGQDGIIFLHRIIEGGASKSYGVQVAKLAGVPPSVIARSREVLEELQRGFERESRTPQLSRAKTKPDDQLALFPDADDQLRDEMRAIDPDRMTPLEALQRLRDWKDRFC